LAKYGAVARVLGDAQRLGVTKIGFVGQEQYMQ
jgi:biopolymer transport protein ExbD